MDSSYEVNQHLAAPTDLRFKLNKIRSKVTLHGDPESLRADSSQKRVRRHHALTHKKNASPTTAKTEDAPIFTLLKLLIDQIFHVIKHQSWVKLPKPVKHDTDSLKAGNCSFHGSRGHATRYCWALKRHLKNLIQRGYLEEFIIYLEEHPEVREAPMGTVD